MHIFTSRGYTFALHGDQGEKILSKEEDRFRTSVDVMINTAIVFLRITKLYFSPFIQVDW